MMSTEEQRSFDRWLKANAIGGLILTAGLLVMALAGTNSAAPRDTAALPSTIACQFSRRANIQWIIPAADAPRSCYMLTKAKFTAS
jgi:hypothetical protein